MLPITSGILPFGLVMGTVYHHAKVTLVQAAGMNVSVFGGAAQLAVIDLMLYKTSILIIIITGLIINLRFMLYSADFAPYIQNSSFWVRIFCTFHLTDQTYAVLKANESHFKTSVEAVQFFMGSCVCMLIAWHGSVLVGFVFGNFLPQNLSLDYAIPLSFVALAMPTMKNKKYIIVAILAATLAVILKPLPYNLGLLIATFISLSFATYLTRRSSTLETSQTKDEDDLEFILNVDLKSKTENLE